VVWVCQGVFDHRRFFLLKKMTVPLVFLYPGVNGTFGSSNIDLHTAAGDSVYSAICFGVPLVLCGIQVFLNNLGKFVYSSYVVFSQNPDDVVKLLHGCIEGKHSWYQPSYQWVVSG
jgi:hypothetical protein